MSKLRLAETRYDPSWQDILPLAFDTLDSQYLESLSQNTTWLPGKEKILNAFQLPLDKVQYVLLGESPYPRPESANGYAFWDAAVNELWSNSGLSKKVNRATSLRNIIKMLLVAEGKLDPDNTQQSEIAKLDKTGFVQTNGAFFQNFLNQGFLLLNASLVLQDQSVRRDASAWRPFLQAILTALLKEKPGIRFILLGNIANEVNNLVSINPSQVFYAEHPYNLSFIQNPKVLDFFKPLHLLRENQF